MVFLVNTFFLINNSFFIIPTEKNNTQTFFYLKKNYENISYWRIVGWRCVIKNSSYVRFIEKYYSFIKLESNKMSIIRRHAYTHLHFDARNIQMQKDVPTFQVISDELSAIVLKNYNEDLFISIIKFFTFFYHTYQLNKSIKFHIDLYNRMM